MYRIAIERFELKLIVEIDRFELKLIVEIDRIEIEQNRKIKDV